MTTTPVNVQIPSDSEAPIVADFVEHALRVAYVDRQYLSSLPVGDWDVPGVYVLLTGDGTGRVYVGQARKLRSRILQHNANEKLPWRRAVIVQRDTTDGFNTAEIGYLEGRLSAEVSALSNTTVIEGKSSGDDTLPKHMMISLDAFVKSILLALRLAGIDTARSNPESEPMDDLPQELPESESGSGRTRLPTVRIADLVSSGLLRAGETLCLRQGRVQATGSITADGEIVVRGISYKSPSSAAANALKLKSSNGWTTWHVGTLSGPTLDWLRWQWLDQQQRKAQ